MNRWMKKILGKTLLLSLFACLISLQGLLAQDARTLLKFEDAEKAYDKGNYHQVISLLDEVESQTGVTSRTLFLRIVAAYGLLDSTGGIYENQNGFQQLAKLRASAANYLKHLASQPIDDKYRRIYEISKALDSFPASFDKWKLKYESISRQKEQAHLVDANCIFEMVYIFREGLCSVCLNGRWGAIDRTGNVVIDFKYDHLEMCHEGLMIAQYNGQKGFLDKKGNWAIEPAFENVGEFNARLAPVKKTGQNEVIYIDKTGRPVFTIKAKEAGSFFDGLALYKAANNKCGYINTSGKIVIKAKYPVSEIQPGSDGLFRVGKHDFYNAEGNLVLSLENYDNVGVFSKGLAPVSKNNKAGFVNKQGVLVIQPAFDEIGRAPFNEMGLACVRIGSKWGFIDRTGKMVIAPKYDFAVNFFDGLAQVGHIDTANKQANVYFIDSTMQIKGSAPSGVENVWYFSQGLAPIKINGRWGFIDKQGEILPIKRN
jgi:hypothetical protein